MFEIKIKNAFLNGKRKDLLINKGKIIKIRRKIKEKAEIEIEAKNLALAPVFFNMHTHLAMTLFRGFGDDLPLKKWLFKEIWPRELLLNEKKIEKGSWIGVRELLKSGVVGFCDMYWLPYKTAEVVLKKGLSAIIGVPFFDKGLSLFSKKFAIKNYLKLKAIAKKSCLIKIAIAPHAIYTVSEKNLVWAKEFAKKENLYYHIHLAETKEEFDFCLKKYHLTPVALLEKLKILDGKTILAHCVYLTDKDIKILAKRKPLVVYCPTSNLKLKVGQVFPFKKLKTAGARIALGTDGAASNNNLDILEEMKIGALLQKSQPHFREVKAQEIFEAASLVPAQFLKIDNQIEENKEANLNLIDLSLEEFSGSKNLISHLVYSANYHCIKYLIFKGKIIYQRD